MKHLLTLLFSTSLTAFSQVQILTLPGHGINAICHHNTPACICGSGEVVARDVTKPDTLRAIILATMCRRCAAEAIRGYVVIEQGKRPVYLNRCKKALKGSQVGWDFREVDGNYKKK